jgi:orotidine-5'-phosphate decarboxylase
LQSVDEFAQLDQMKSARDRIILALDVDTRAEAMDLVGKLSPYAGAMKIGLQLFTAEGPELVRAIRDTDSAVFLDLKLHDIPNTVARTIESAAKLDVQMLTLHLCGGREMILRGAEAGAPGLKLIGVTVLTTANRETLREIGVDRDVPEQVIHLARLGVECGLHGIVASGQELVFLRKTVGNKLRYVIPGIRPSGVDANDQKRTMTPSEAIVAGADYLVIGRPITAAADPVAAARRILEEIER